MPQHCYHKCWLNPPRVERRGVDHNSWLAKMSFTMLISTLVNFNGHYCPVTINLEGIHILSRYLVSEIIKEIYFILSYLPYFNLYSIGKQIIVLFPYRWLVFTVDYTTWCTDYGPGAYWTPIFCHHH